MTANHVHFGSPDLIGIPNRPPIVASFEEFEEWMRSEWDVLKFRYKDWRESRNPKYEFIIRWKKFSFPENKIEGFVHGDGVAIFFIDTSSEYFTREFLMKFCERFPEKRNDIILQWPENLVEYEPSNDPDFVLAQLQEETCTDEKTLELYERFSDDGDA